MGGDIIFLFFIYYTSTNLPKKELPLKVVGWVGWGETGLRPTCGIVRKLTRETPTHTSAQSGRKKWENQKTKKHTWAHKKEKPQHTRAHKAAKKRETQKNKKDETDKKDPNTHEHTKKRDLNTHQHAKRPKNGKPNKKGN